MAIAGSDAPSGSAPTCVVFDVCNTLYDENTTFGFVRFYNAGRNWRRLVAVLVSRRASPLYWLLGLIYRATGVDLPRRAVIASLTGEPEGKLRSAARDYVRSHLSARAIAETQARLARHRSAGDRIVLISNSLDPVVEAIADRLGVEWKASRLGIRDGRLTGGLAIDLTGRKLEVARTILAEHAPRPRLVVYTDNLSDLALVEAADEAVVIIPPGGDRAAWHGVRAEFLAAP